MGFLRQTDGVEYLLGGICAGPAKTGGAASGQIVLLDKQGLFA